LGLVQPLAIHTRLWLAVQITPRDERNPSTSIAHLRKLFTNTFELILPDNDFVAFTRRKLSGGPFEIPDVPIRTDRKNCDQEEAECGANHAMSEKRLKEITNDAAERTNSIKPGAFSLHRVCGPYGNRASWNGVPMRRDLQR